MPKPSVALWRPKPTIRTTARLISPEAPAWPMASPSEKLCRPMPVAINTREPRRSRERRDPRLLELGGGRRTGPERRLVPLPLHPAVVVDEAHQPDGEADREQGRVPGEVRPAPAVHRTGERLVHRLDRAVDHVVEQEEEDARGERAQRRLQPDVRCRQPPQRETDEDRRSGDGCRGPGSGSEDKSGVPSGCCKAYLTSGRDYSLDPGRTSSANRHGPTALGRRIPRDDLVPRLPDRRVPAHDHGHAHPRVACGGDARRLAGLRGRDAEAPRGGGPGRARESTRRRS